VASLMVDASSASVRGAPHKHIRYY
jgi:hypothetical protein